MATGFRVKQGFGRRPPRLGRLFDMSPLYFVTFCTHLRKPFLARDDVHSAFVAYSERARDLNVAVGRYVIMPDHIHLFVRGSQVFELSPETSFSKSR
jgi:REP element-mobilizing transposase RayT